MSSLTWMDFSEHERRQALELIDMFNEPEARDELGIGTVRDALAELLFPGTSTIQTRVKYFLFVPWMYKELEHKQVPSRRVAKEARRLETDLIKALLESDDTDGIIGRDVRENLKRLPSNVYWQGLYRWGIRSYYGSQDPYHRSLDGFYATKNRKTSKTDDGDPLDDIWSNWHGGLPPKSEGFPYEASFHLTYDEASYLRDRVLHSVQKTMLAYLVSLEQPFERVDFPWELPAAQKMPLSMKKNLEHAKHFSFSIHGAALLYNLMLSELVNSDDLKVKYTEMLAEWWLSMNQLRDSLLTWDRDDFWKAVKSENARITERTQNFINSWLHIALTALQHNQSLEDISSANRLFIKNREFQLKKGKARLSQPKALQNWLGESGAAQLNFRWRTTQTIVLDILSGLKGNQSHA